MTTESSILVAVAETNVFAAIAAEDKHAADVLAAAFDAARNMAEVWACLRYARRMTGYSNEYASWLDGSAFYSATAPYRIGYDAPCEILESNEGAFEAIREQVQDYVG